MGNEPVKVADKPIKRVELTPQDMKDAHWFYDTPGITKENCVCILKTLTSFFLMLTITDVPHLPPLLPLSPFFLFLAIEFIS